MAVAAAVISFAVHLFAPTALQDRSLAVNQRPPLSQAADINHDGRVNILDAYVLARRRSNVMSRSIRRGMLNGDGVVDQKDVDLIAGIWRCKWRIRSRRDEAVWALILRGTGFQPV